jgi:hypothetical protein
LAPDLQFGKFMRILLISLLAFSMPAVAAAESGCAAAYDQAHMRYFSKIEKLENQEIALRTGGIAIGSGAVYCLWRARSMGARESIVLCAGALGAVLIGSQAYRYRILGQIKRLQDAYKIFEAYYQIVQKNYGDESVQELFNLTGARTADERALTAEFQKMMDSGEFCGGPTGTKPVMSWEDAIAALTQRKNSAP